MSATRHDDLRPARYDAVADFYAETFADGDDPTVTMLLDVIRGVAGRTVLDLACGSGRISRALAARGAVVTGVDLSTQMLAQGRAREAERPLGIRYLHGDAADPTWLDRTYAVVSCGFGLSDIDDLEGALTTVVRALQPDGEFVCSLLHPCYPGSLDADAAWPRGGSYHDEGFWLADAPHSTLRRQVGSNHRTLSTYVNTLVRSGLSIVEMVEPRAGRGLDGPARVPTYLVLRCRPSAPA